ncbi:putative fatty-acid--CoA ligase FadD10 [Allomyces javanicus]|nr:putative fatty-acid--CoA ligase FadD10 [Allomyces javanicus]
MPTSCETVAASTEANLDSFVIRSPVVVDAAKLIAASPASLTVGKVILSKLHDHDPNRVFVAHAMDPERRRQTYGELLAGALGLAHGLITNLGLNRGDRLAIVAPNHEHYHMVFFACLFSGIIAVPLALKIAEQSMPVIIYDSVTDGLDLDESTVLLRDLIVPGQKLPPPTFAEVQQVDVAFMLFTSGTTGTNKAVEITHQMMIVNLAQAQAFAVSLTSGVQSDGLASMKLLSDNAQGTPMACSGFFHLSGTLMGMATAVQGGTMYFMEEFDAGKWLDAIARAKIGQLSMTPHNLVQIIKHPRANSTDLSSLKLIFSIAAPLSAPTQVRIMKGLKAPVVQSYASTETLNLTSPRLRLDKVAPPGAIGWLIPGMEAMLIDPETLEPIQVVKDGVTGPGEIIYRGPNLFSRYFHRPQETKDAFIDIGGKSWYRMGDLCTVDQDGCLTVVDRSKEMIKTGGNTVIPTELESLILRLPTVADVVVVPVPGGDEQVVPCAAVVPQYLAVLDDTAAQTKLAKDITNVVAQELAAYKYLTGGVVFLDAVPRTVTVCFAFV